jgi:chromosome segregation ATPase
MVEPDNLVLTLLREMRADMNARFEALESRMEARFDAVDKRFEAIERRLEMMHRNGEKALRGFIGHRAMVERTMASFEDEISSLKRRVERLETAEA